MSAEKIAAYQQALREFTATTSKIESMVQGVTDAADALSQGRWQRACIGGVGGLGWPAAIVMGKGPRVEASRWPDLQVLAESMALWHDLKHNVMSAWSSIPQPDRVGLAAPDGRL
jgi:hypothetical protein